MKLFFLVLFWIPFSAVGMSLQPCSEDQKIAYAEVGRIPRYMTAFYLATNLASTVLAVQSIPKDSEGKKELPLWVMLSAGGIFIPIMTSPRCNLMKIEGDKVFYADSEKEIKKSIRAVWATSLIFGQTIALTNASDSEKRSSIQAIMGSMILSQGLFELFWSFKPATSNYSILPWSQKESTGIQLVYRW